MELPNQNHPFLFDQMLQMFPNIPHDVILLYTLQYSNDVEKCIEMLKMQNGKYTETEQTDFILNISADQKLSIVNMKPNQHTDSFGDENFDKSFQSSNNSELNIFNNNAGIEYVIQNDRNDELPNFERNLQCSKENTNEEFFQNEELMPYAKSSNIQPQCSLSMPDNKNTVESQQKIFANGILNISPLHLETSSALHINIGDNGENNHSWRPNTNFDGLYNDFFLSSPFFDNATKNSEPLKHSLPQSNTYSELDQISLSAFPVKNLSNPFVSSPNNFQYEDKSRLSNDILNILNFQRIQLNVMKYEVMKSKTDLDNLKEEVGKLSLELKEKKHSREALNIKELGKQNSELRMECQCLCMEVDYYLKGKALLGETDENTYKIRQPPKEQACDHHSDSNGDDAFDPVDELDELNKWDCSKCTFANHPAINTCEMCQMPRPRPKRTVFASSVPETCYCHSSKESPPLSS